jgi:ABC-2 type transport system ATP-binding protein
MAGAAQVRVRTPQPDKLAAALAELKASVAPQPDGMLVVNGLDTAAVGHAAFTAGVELHELSAQRFDLEQLFFALTEAPAQATSPTPGGQPAPQPSQGGSP